jgi:hypothetical protein
MERDVLLTFLSFSNNELSAVDELYIVRLITHPTVIINYVVCQPIFAYRCTYQQETRVTLTVMSTVTTTVNAVVKCI